MEKMRRTDGMPRIKVRRAGRDTAKGVGVTEKQGRKTDGTACEKVRRASTGKEARLTEKHETPRRARAVGRWRNAKRKPAAPAGEKKEKAPKKDRHPSKRRAKTRPRITHLRGRMLVS